MNTVKISVLSFVVCCVLATTETCNNGNTKLLPDVAFDVSAYPEAQQLQDSIDNADAKITSLDKNELVVLDILEDALADLQATTDAKEALDLNEYFKNRSFLELTELLTNDRVIDALSEQARHYLYDVFIEYKRTYSSVEELKNVVRLYDVDRVFWGIELMPFGPSTIWSVDSMYVYDEKMENYTDIVKCFFDSDYNIIRTTSVSGSLSDVVGILAETVVLWNKYDPTHYFKSDLSKTELQSKRRLVKIIKEIRELFISSEELKFDYLDELFTLVLDKRLLASLSDEYSKRLTLTRFNGNLVLTFRKTSYYRFVFIRRANDFANTTTITKVHLSLNLYNDEITVKRNELLGINVGNVAQMDKATYIQESNNFIVQEEIERWKTENDGYLENKKIGAFPHLFFFAVFLVFGSFFDFEGLSHSWLDRFGRDVNSWAFFEFELEHALVRSCVVDRVAHRCSVSWQSDVAQERGLGDVGEGDRVGLALARVDDHGVLFECVRGILEYGDLAIEKSSRDDHCYDEQRIDLGEEQDVHHREKNESKKNDVESISSCSISVGGILHGVHG